MAGLDVEDAAEDNSDNTKRSLDVVTLVDLKNRVLLKAAWNIGKKLFGKSSSEFDSLSKAKERGFLRPTVWVGRTTLLGKLSLCRFSGKRFCFLFE